jgi:hypothetical protein
MRHKQLCGALNQMLWFVRARSDIEGIAVRPPNFAGLMWKLIIASAVGRPNMRFAFCSAALLAGGLLLTSFTVASAQSQGAEQKPPEQAEQKPPDQAKGEQKPEDQKSAEQQAEERIKQEIEEYRSCRAAVTLRRVCGVRVDRAQDHEPVVARRCRYRPALSRPLRSFRLLGRASETDLSLRHSSGTDRSKGCGPACCAGPRLLA